MRIAVVCANGKVGRLVVADAEKAGIDVTAIVRGENHTDAEHVISKDLFQLTKDDLKGFDVVVDAFGTWAPDTLPEHTTSLMHLCDILSGTDTRLIVVGGAGSLYTDPSHTTQLMDAPDFPASYKPLAEAMGKSLAELRKRDDVRWTYISPAADFQADGPQTGKYSWGGEELTLNSSGKSEISYADYAQALVEEAQKGNHIRERISVVGKD